MTGLACLATDFQHIDAYLNHPQTLPQNCLTLAVTECHSRNCSLGFQPLYLLEYQHRLMPVVVHIDAHLKCFAVRGLVLSFADTVGLR